MFTKSRVFLFIYSQFSCIIHSSDGVKHRPTVGGKNGKDKILIVEDEVNICELLRLYLEKEGYETAIAHDGETAVEVFGKRRF